MFIFIHTHTHTHVHIGFRVYPGLSQNPILRATAPIVALTREQSLHTQSLQYPFIKEYSLNYGRIRNMI